MSPSASSTFSSSHAEIEASAFPDPTVTVTKEVVTRIPTLDGTMNVHVYRSSRDPTKDHMALVYGDLDELRKGTVLVRVHSECFTGEVLGSLRCDCREQLQNAQKQMAAAGAGVIIYLRQEGRGIGLLNKLKAYNLQDQGLDTYDANVALGKGADERTYDEAILMLRDLGITSVRLLTNNQEKMKLLRMGGISVEERIEMRPQIVTSDILAYLQTKVDRMNHTLDLTEVPLTATVPVLPSPIRSLQPSKKKTTDYDVMVSPNNCVL